MGFMIIFNFFHPERALFNFTPMWPGWACILAVGGTCSSVSCFGLWTYKTKSCASKRNCGRSIADKRVLVPQCERAIQFRLATLDVDGL